MKKKKVFNRTVEEINGHDELALDTLRPRLMWAMMLILIFAGIILSRLWFLQISNSDEFISKADNNRIRKIRVAPPRGHILDRNGLELVTNRPSFDVVLVRENIKNDSELLKRLAKVLDTDVSELWDQIRKAENTPRHIPIRLKTDINWEQLAYLENHNHDFSGISIEVTPRRVYHYGDLAAHIIGYLGEIDQQKLNDAVKGIYKAGDLVGKRGLEKLREADLRGEKGTRLSEVNARGFVQEQLTYEEPLPGRKVQLTLDARLQLVAEAAMNKDGKAGAAVVLDVNSGRVLSLVSTPGIHLDDFVGRLSPEKWSKYLDDEKKPLVNKAVQGQYPPGSTYKMITAIAALQEGVVDQNTVHYCPGFFKLGRKTYRCWKHSGHGAVNLRKAIEQSCDVFFYQVGYQLGVDKLAKYAKMFGLGERTGLEIESERKGIIPTQSWKLDKYKQKWQDGETVIVAIGQGFNLVTPLQIANMTATIANGGRLYKPQLVEKVVGPDGKEIFSLKPELVRDISNLKDDLKLIQQGMFDVVHGKKGTARRAKIKGLTIAGKTGTAQVVRREKYKGMKDENIPYLYRDHAWFTCYAPADKPEIAVTVLVEHGLHGSSGASPVARAVLEAYFAGRLGDDKNTEM